MPKVYVPKKLGHDISDLEQYGEIVIIFDDDFSPFSVDLARDIITKAFKNSTSDSYLVMIGSSVFCSLMTAIWTAMFDDPLRLLIFHAKHRKYIMREIKPA
jgi:hypothetical protein